MLEILSYWYSEKIWASYTAMNTAYILIFVFKFSSVKISEFCSMMIFISVLYYTGQSRRQGSWCYERIDIKRITKSFEKRIIFVPVSLSGWQYPTTDLLDPSLLLWIQQWIERRIPFIFDDFHFCRSRVIGLDMTENRIFTLCRMITWVVFLKCFEILSAANR
jgi:hypothetical protein